MVIDKTGNLVVRETWTMVMNNGYLYIKERTLQGAHYGND